LGECTLYILDVVYKLHFILCYYPDVLGAMSCDQKSFKIVWRCYQLLSGFLSKGHLPRGSCKLRLSDNNNGDNEMILRAVHRSPGIEWKFIFCFIMTGISSNLLDIGLQIYFISYIPTPLIRLKYEYISLNRTHFIMQ
jgi:hypothetical protein